MADSEAPPHAAASAFALRSGDPDGFWPIPDWLLPVKEDPDYAWAIHAWRCAATVEGTWFDSGLAEGVVTDWPGWARLTKDRFAGVPFKLSLWEEIIVRLLVGWQVPSEVLDPLTHLPTVVHVRLFRKLLLWIPRKNGKTEFLAALGLLFFTLDGLIDGEGYVFARDEDQGRIPFNMMKRMAAYSPDLKDDMLGYGKSLYSKSLRGSIQLLTGADDGKHGKNPSVTVGDEMHEWRSLEISNTLRQGSAGRLQPIELYASTAGRKSNKIGMQIWRDSLAIMEGRKFEPTTLVVIFAAPPEADYRDEKVWARANPSLGLSPTISYLRLEAAAAADNPRAEAAFRCYHLNQWIDGEVRWLPLKYWDACTDDAKGWKTAAERYRGRLCYGALDVSSTRDITALTWTFPPTDDDPKWRSVSRFWVPEDTLVERAKQDKAPYEEFERAGALETTPGNSVDQNYVFKAVLEGIADFDVQKIGFDPWNARKLVADLHKEGVAVEMTVEMRQGAQSLGEGAKEYERLIYAGEFDHGGDPVLRWMAGHVVVRFDENLNFVPAKKRSPEKIDGIVTNVMTVALVLADTEEESVPEVR